MDRVEINDLTEKLNDRDINVRNQVRFLLVNARSDAVPSLIEMLHSQDSNQRLEAVRLLGRIKDRSAAVELVELLIDENMGVHWAASDALIGLGGGAILPLLEGLTRHFDSSRFRQGAHHTLHAFKEMGSLEPHVNDVLVALQETEPFASVPWAAERAIEALTIQ